MRNLRVTSVLALVWLGLLGVGCGDDADDDGATGGGGAGSASTGTASVSPSSSSSSTSAGSSVSTSTGGEGGSGEGGIASGGSGGSGGGGAVDTEIEWSPCPLFIDQPDGPQAECASVDVPLRRSEHASEPDGPTIGVFVQRLSGTTPGPRKQLWLLEGGPGGSGADFDAWMEQMREMEPGFDLYAVDHRGVGRSARLDCPEQETPESEWGINVSSGEVGACHASLLETWADDLAEFSSTAAALDLGRLIDLAQAPGEDVFVYGVSYGTYWAHRYLQVHPDQATAVILDSIAPSTATFVEFDADFDAVGRDLLDLCRDDALCAEKLGTEPWAAVEDLHAALEAGHCPELSETWGLDATTSRTVLAVLLMSPLTRTYLPAMVYRHARCDAGDVAAIDRLLTVLFADSTTTYYDTLSSDALFYNVAYSELWPNEADHPTVEEIEQVDADLHVTTELTRRLVEAQDAWAPYADDDFVGGWATTSTPLLMMNGDLDPQTPIWMAADIAPHFTGPNQTFLTVPRAAHCVVCQTPVATEGERSCGMKLFLDFLHDPLAEPDTSCYADIPGESFTGDPAWNAYLLGETDLWENGGPQLVAAPVLSARNARVLRDVRRRIAEVVRASRR